MMHNVEGGMQLHAIHLYVCGVVRGDDRVFDLRNTANQYNIGSKHMTHQTSRVKSHR